MAAVSEAASVVAVRRVYEELLNSPGNIYVIYDGSWMNRGHRSYIAVGCIIELYTGLAIDYVVLCNFCL